MYSSFDRQLPPGQLRGQYAQYDDEDYPHQNHRGWRESGSTPLASQPQGDHHKPSGERRNVGGFLHQSSSHPKTTSHQSNANLNNQVNDLTKILQDVLIEIRSLRAEVADQKAEMKGLRAEMKELKAEFRDVAQTFGESRPVRDLPIQGTGQGKPDPSDRNIRNCELCETKFQYKIASSHFAGKRHQDCLRELKQTKDPSYLDWIHHMKEIYGFDQGDHERSQKDGREIPNSFSPTVPTYNGSGVYRGGGHYAGHHGGEPYHAQGHGRGY